MRILYLLISLSIISGPAFAQCASLDDTFMSCTLANGRKAVHVCVDGPDLTYSFGRIGQAPELTLSVPVVDANYIPWPGISNIFETVIFTNRKISYVVTGGKHRIYPKQDDGEIEVEVWGNIEVIENRNDVENEKVLAVLECDAGSVHFSYGGSIYDAKKAANQCWNSYDQQWNACE
ncbi:MAG: hypothetical protein KAT26_04390 [Marinosulfonomonas sp.]|nr:hypothetical protein [Marinosulfonomonas sp.]